MSDLRCLRGEDLGELAPRLAPFVRAYQWDSYRVAFEKSYDRGLRLRELAEEGVETLPQDVSFTELLEDCYFSRNGYYPDEHPDLSQGDNFQ
jgi:hypothetical protein